MLRHHPSVMLRSVSAIPVTLVGGIFGVEYVLFMNGYLLTPLETHEHFFLTRGIVGFMFHFTVVCAAIAFAKTVLTDPGYVDAHMIEQLKDSFQEAMERGSHSMNPFEDRQGFDLPTCRRCHQFKPIRAHHCSMCNRCVFRMDHHCPWVGNCVGAKNYRFFLQFVFYAWISCLMVFCGNIGEFKRSVVDGNGASFQSQLAWQRFSSQAHSSDQGTIPGDDDTLATANSSDMALWAIVAFVLSASLCVALLLFVLFHSWLASNGLTTLECHIYGSHSPFTQGLAGNWRVAMGHEFGWKWFVPWDSLWFGSSSPPASSTSSRPSGQHSSSQAVQMSPNEWNLFHGQSILRSANNPRQQQQQQPAHLDDQEEDQGDGHDELVRLL